MTTEPSVDRGSNVDRGSGVDRGRIAWLLLGALALLLGTLLVAVIAALIAVPIGLTTAIYLSEYARPKLRSYAKPVLELLAGIPSVVYGFLAVSTITPVLAFLIPGLERPFNQISGGIVVGIMIIPMVASLSEDALRAVPRSLRGHILLGQTLAALGREKEAAAAYRRALEIDPFSNEANRRLIELSFGANR